MLGFLYGNIYMYKGMKYSFLLIIKYIYILYPLFKKMLTVLYFLSLFLFFYLISISCILFTFLKHFIQLTQNLQKTVEYYFEKVFFVCFYLPDVEVFSIGTSTDNIGKNDSSSILHFMLQTIWSILAFLSCSILNIPIKSTI